MNLRKLQFSKRYIRDIGIIDNNGIIYCTAGLGNIDPPIKMMAPHRESNSFKYWWNIQIPLSDNKVRSAAKQLGRYITFVDPNVNQDLINSIRGNSFINALSWGSAGKNLIIISNGKNIDTIEAHLKNKSSKLNGIFDCKFYVSTNSQDEMYTLHSVINCLDAFKAQSRFALTLLTSGFLLAVLTSMLLSPRLRRLSRSKYRMKFLCRYENIICHYQPVIDMHANEIIGCEVLVRIRDGQKILYPDQFLKDIAEQGMTWTLDAIVSKKALQELNQKITPEKPFRVAFNFFPDDVKYDLLSRHFDEQLSNCNKNFCVGIEVTEHSLSEEIIHEITRIKKTGYELSVDDFGTGYSNLRIVKNIEPDIIKIDKSFVFDMEESSIRSSMIPQIIDIATTVGARVIAEGVENAEQRDLLVKLGVRYGQGYYFGRPMPIESFAKLFEDQIHEHAEKRLNQKVVRIFPG